MNGCKDLENSSSGSGKRFSRDVYKRQPTRKQIIPCTSSERQQETYVWKKNERTMIFMARSTTSYEERMLQLEKKEQESLEKAKQYAACLLYTSDLTVSVKNIMNEAYCRDISIKTRSSLEVKRRNGD